MSLQDDIHRAEKLLNRNRVRLEKATSDWEGVRGRRLKQLTDDSPKMSRDVIKATLDDEQSRRDNPLGVSWRFMKAMQAYAWRARTRYDILEPQYYQWLKHFG